MKKKLLFSLLLGSAFIWTNKLCAAEAAPAIAPAAEEVKPAGDKAAVNAPKEAKKIVTKTLQQGKIGEEITVTYHQESDEIIYDNIAMADAGIYIGPKYNAPFVPGVKGAPVGYKIITLWFPIDPNGSEEGSFGKFNPDFEKAIINVGKPDDFDQPPGYTYTDKYMWGLMSDQNEIFMGKFEKDANADEYYGNQMYDATRKKADLDFMRYFRLPNKEATAKLQAALNKSAELEKAAGSGGGASSEEVEKLKAELAAAKAAQGNGSAAQAIDPSAPLTKTFEFEGMKFLALASSPEAKKHPELFDELVMGLFKLFSTQPKVATAIIATMLKSDPTMEGGGQFVNVSISNAYKLLGSDQEIDLVADVQFSTDVSYIKAEEFIAGLKVKYNNDDVVIPEPPVPAEEVAELQAKQEAELKVKKQELAKIEADKKLALQAVEKLSEEKAALEAKAEQDNLEKEKLKQERDTAVTVAAQAYDKVEETTRAAERNFQIAIENDQEATQKNVEIKHLEEALNESELEKQKALNEAEAEKARLAAAHQQTQSALEETKNDLMETKISEATLTAKHEAATTAALKAEQDKAKVMEELKNTHVTLLDLADSNSTTANEPTTTIPSENTNKNSDGSAPAVALAKKQDSTSVTDLDAIAKEHGVPNNKQLTADILNKSVPHPLVSSLASASAAPAA